MAEPAQLLLASRPWLRAGLRTSVLVVALLSSFAVSAQTYPISGVWVAMEHQFLASRTGACLTLKTNGANALFGKSAFPAVMIFSDGRRFVVRGGRSAELALSSVRSVANGGFRITEAPGKRGGWLPWFRNHVFYLRIVDPMLIEIAEGSFKTRFFKCWSGLTPV
jgi:hypothetical protein